MPRRLIVVLLSTLVGVALLQCGVALADTVTTNFENFNACTPLAPVVAPAPTCGTVNGQNGWKSAIPGDIPSLPNGYDQQVVVNSEITGHPAPASFGAQSLRLSNAYNPDPGTSPPEFFYQTYSTPTINPAGEDLSNTEYIGQFSFISVDPNHVQNGLKISVSPDNGSGGRMSYVELDDVDTTVNGITENGIDVVFYDVAPDGDFVAHDLGVLPRNVEHTITFWMKLNPGSANDLLRIYIDGKDFGQCFTTWESFYETTKQLVPESDRLLFLSGSRDGNHLNLVGGGYLFDNVQTETSDGPGPPGCDVPIDKLPGAPIVSPGGLAHYRITVRNRGRLTERYLLVCDHIPSETTFVSATPTLRRLGRRRCLFIPSLRPGQRSGFNIVLRVNANARPGTLDNTADETPVEPPGVPPVTVVPPTSPEAPALPGTITDVVPPKAKVKVAVKVAAKRVTPPPPAVTG
jgi:uncharacterized repeat protein (TIGR01451 family)